MIFTESNCDRNDIMNGFCFYICTINWILAHILHLSKVRHCTSIKYVQEHLKFCDEGQKFIIILCTFFFRTMLIMLYSLSLAKSDQTEVFRKCVERDFFTGRLIKS